MRHGKHEAPNSRKAKITTVALVVLLCCAVGGTLAWLAASTKPVTNTFTPAQVQCVVTDNYSNNKKTDIQVKNPNEPRNVDAYVRVTLVPTWEDGAGNAIAKTVSAADVVYPQTLNENWFKGSDGYYYYKNVLKVGGETSALFGSAISVAADSPNVLNLQVLAEAIQADGMDGDKHVVESVWPTVTVGAGGTLSAK